MRALYMTAMLFALLGAACRKDEVSTPAGTPIGPGRLVVNEMVASGSKQRNEFEEASDWVELYVPGEALELKTGSWYITDDLEHEPLKYELPEVEVAENGFLVIWCDGLDGVADGIHANFELSDRDDRFALVHVDGDMVQVIDAVDVRSADMAGLSFGRDPDGTASWTQLAYPTPGSTNEPITPQN